MASKRNIKRIKRMLVCCISILLVLVLCIVLISCAGKSNSSYEAEDESGTEAESAAETSTITGQSTGIVYNSDGTVTFNTPDYLADVDLESDAENLLDTDEAPALYYGYSEFFGPWIYNFYALDEKSNYEYHDVEDDDGYVPHAGDLLITGDEDCDYYYLESSIAASGLRVFPYWHGCETWNGHILYVADVDDEGNMVCYEGNAIAPYQDLDIDDDDYIDESSIDCIVINFYSDETLTAGKNDEKPIRAVIQTNYSDAAVDLINNAAYEALVAFNEDPDSVRSEIQYLYDIADINWCGLFVHYILLQALPEAELYESDEQESFDFETRPAPEFGGHGGR